MYHQLVQARQDNVLRVGIQVRTGDGVIRNKVKYNTTRAALYFRCVEDLLSGYQRASRGGQYLIFLISDSADLRRDYKKIYGDSLLTDLDLIVR